MLSRTTAGSRVAAMLLVSTLLACGRPMATQSTGSVPGSTSAPATAVDATVQDAQLVSQQFGWAYTAKALAVTADGGTTWRPFTVSANPILGVGFADQSHGWVISQPQTPAPTLTATVLSVYRTTDGGLTWVPSTMTAHPVGGVRVDRATFDFVSPTHGWMLLDDSSDANVSRGEVFQTIDGGATWTGGTATAFGVVRFMTSNDGYIATQDAILVSHDGGGTWKRASVTALSSAGAVDYFDVMSTSRPHGAKNIAPVLLMHRNPFGVLGTGFLETQDRGDTWRLVSHNSVDKPDAGLAGSASIASTTDWFVALPDASGNPMLKTTANGGRTWSRRALSGYEGSWISAIDFATARTGWAVFSRAGCLSQKQNCYSNATLAATNDGGATWVTLSPP